MPADDEAADAICRSGAPVKRGDVVDGKYVIERLLGAGGMGVVVQARHRTLGTRVAIKFLRPELAQDPEVSARLLREGQTVSRFTGEHVARVLDLGSLESGAPYIVMEYLEGRDLGAILERRGTISAADAVEYVLQACEALAEGHAEGVVHRDLKPANLFVTRAADGGVLVKVLDFGVSKARKVDASNLTETMRILGTPLYMAPEQIRSAKRADARSDIWSLGVILYELVTGRTPFQGLTGAVIIGNILETSPSPASTLNGKLSREFDAAVARCLEKDPSARFQNVAELARALAPLGKPTAIQAAERIERILMRSDLVGGSELTQPETPAFEAPTPVMPAEPAVPRTVSSWEERARLAGAQPKLLLAAVAVGVSIFVAVLTGVLAARRAGHDATNPPVIAATSVAPPPAAPTAPPPIAEPVVEPSAAPLASTSASESKPMPVKAPVIRREPTIDSLIQRRR